MKRLLQKLAPIKSKVPYLPKPSLPPSLSASRLAEVLAFANKKNPLHKRRDAPGKPKKQEDQNKDPTPRTIEELFKLVKKGQDGKDGDPDEEKNNQRRISMIRNIINLVVGAFGVYTILWLYEQMQTLVKPLMTYESLEDNLKKRAIGLITVTKQIKNGKVVRDVRVTANGVEHMLKVHDIDAFLGNLEAMMRDLGYLENEMVPVKFRNVLDSSNEFWDIMMSSLIITLSFYLLYRLKGLKASFNEMMPQAKSVAKTFEVKKLAGGFETIAGLDSAKLEIKEFVEFLKNPFMFANLGARMPKGALLTGLPGTGKTLLAKACAFESGVSFFSVSGSDFVEKYVGVGASNVRKLFEEAKRKAPAVIFIDEIDAIGKKRDDAALMTNSERENTLNQLLVEMDGFDSKTSIIVLAATNRPNILDPALTRPGRLDRHIALTLPDLAAREKIFLLYLQKLKLEENSLNYLAKRLATLSPGFSGADVANLCNEAAILAARESKELVSVQYFEEAAERVIAGLRRHNLITEEEKKLVAIHESGHATASWFLEGADPLVKVTIVPRSKGALGFAQYLVDDADIHTKAELLDRIVFILGGRVAEDIFFGKISTGAQDDLQKAFDIAEAVVSSYGMVEEFAYVSLEGEDEKNSFIDTKQKKLYSDETQEKIDEQIKGIIENCYRRCYDLLKSKRDLVERLSQKLIQNESVNLKDLIDIFGERPFAPNPSFEEYLKNQAVIASEDEQK